MEEAFEKAMSADGPELLRLEARQYPNLDAYIRDIYCKYIGEDLLENIEEIAFAVEPIDRDLGMDEDMPAAMSFCKGSLLGLRVAYEFVPQDMQDRLGKIDICKAYYSPDEYQNAHDKAKDILDCCEWGYMQAETYHSLLEDWEDELSRDVTMQPYLKRGFGVVMYMIHGLYEGYLIEDRQKMAAEVGNVDWDTEFAPLLDQEG